jgi:putative heme transporter
MTAVPSPDPPGSAASAAGAVEVRWWSIVVTVAVVATLIVVAARMADRLVDVAGLTLAAVALALLTAPIQERTSRLIGSAGGITFTALATLAAVFGVGAAALTDLRVQLGALGTTVGDRIDALEPGSLPARVATALRIDAAIAEWSGEVPTQVVTGQDTGTAVGRQLMSVFFVVVLAAFLQASRRALVAQAVSRWPRPADVDRAGAGTSRLEVRQFLDEVERRGAGFARSVLVVGGVAAAITAGSAALLQVPGALVLGLWVGAWCVVPSVGWFVACLPAAALAVVDPRVGTVVAGAVALVVSVAGALVRRRVLEPRGVRLGASVHVGAVAIGVALGGMAGTFVAVMVAAVGVAAVTCPDRPGWPAPAGGRRHEFVVGGYRRTVRSPSAAQAAALAVAAATGVAFGLAVLQRLAPAIAWILIGGFAAIALRRPADWIERRGLGPYAARSVVLSIVAAVVVACVLAGAEQGVQASSRVAERLPEIVGDLERAPLVGAWLSERDASTWVSDQIADAPQRLSAARPSTWLPGVTARLVDLWWTIVIAAAFLFDGERVVRGAVARVPAARRRQAQRLVAATGTALTGYAAGAALLATINGTVVFSIAVVLGLGLAPVVAVWAFVWNFVPQIGGFMGGVPLILFALVSGPAHALVASGLFLTYQLIENHVIQPAVIGAAIDVPPWGTLLAALAGGAAAGVLGAVLLTPLVGVVRVIRRELRRDDFPGSVVAVPTIRQDGPSG